MRINKPWRKNELIAETHLVLQIKIPERAARIAPSSRIPSLVFALSIIDATRHAVLIDMLCQLHGCARRLFDVPVASGIRLRIFPELRNIGVRNVPYPSIVRHIVACVVAEHAHEAFRSFIGLIKDISERHIVRQRLIMRTQPCIIEEDVAIAGNSAVQSDIVMIRQIDGCHRTIVEGFHIAIIRSCDRIMRSFVGIVIIQ